MRDLAPFRYWGIEPPPLHLLMNRVQTVSANARQIQQALRDVYRDQDGISALRRRKRVLLARTASRSRNMSRASAISTAVGLMAGSARRGLLQG